MLFTELNNGVKMPVMGYGVFRIPDLEQCERCVLERLQLDY
jgi:2,5-diketo-D-gluconate reductase A